MIINEQGNKITLTFKQEPIAYNKEGKIMLVDTKKIVDALIHYNDCDEVIGITFEMEIKAVLLDEQQYENIVLPKVRILSPKVRLLE